MIITLTSFGSQVLHNGTTHLATKSLLPASKAESNLVELPDGSYFDPYGSANAPVKPGALATTVAFVFATQASLNTEVAAIYAKIGTKATLTATRLDATTTTCSARLESVELAHPFPLVTGARTRLTLRFQCVTNFV